ncbi:FIST N-terminal domain-containing protein [Magnetospirillum sp. SS-4]|uniref:FIST N-terminal domain-containing protein n=1 Tax=Magnetospirillum sp. SS-4 TaxID=2681465 RepID=UPI0013853FBE|nr:FIST N-terminal domain-containing protein [Magnetospirillum sp. SS-4]CAA7612302.1 Histidine kinase [Magnetospirillum sp. SS-4]
MSRRPSGRRFRPAKGSGKAVSASMIQQAVSTRSDPLEAVRELHAAIARQPLGLAVVFCSKRYDKDALEQAFQEVFGDDAPLVGCTTAGEVSMLGYTDGTMTGLGLAAEACVAVSDFIPEISGFKPAQGRAVVASLLEELRRQGIEPTPHDTFGLLMIDGMRFVEEQVISTLNAALNGLPLFGGSAGDDMAFSDPQVLFRGRFHSDAAILTLVHTRLPFKVFSSQHFVGSGEQAIVTGADPDRRIITELNGESAALEYARLLGRDIEELRTQDIPLAPLVVRIGGAWYARSPERINDDNSLQLACAIDEGVPLSIGRNTGMIPNLQKTFETIHAAIGEPVAVLGFDCVVRRVEAFATGLQADAARLFAANRVIGCSAYGEQINGMHLNHTLTGVAFGRPVGVRAPAPACAPATPADGSEVTRLESENAKLRKTVRVLLQRIERSMNLPSDTFSLFQNNVLLETTVQRRTEEMAELNRKLNQELIARRETDAALTAAKAEAERANLSKTKFLASVSHDLQQPLNAARLLLGALMEEDLSSAGRSLLGRIEGALEAAEEMLADFLDVAKLESGGVTAHSSHFPIAQLLSQLEAEYTPQARRKGLVLTIVQSSAMLYSDKGLLQRILRNLLANAVRYTKRGRILVGCRRGAGGLLVEVHDTGIGIPADRLQEVFQPYLRIDSGDPSATRGSGLGLTIAKNIADILGLTLAVRSVEGAGSTFTIGIPMAANAILPEPLPPRTGTAAALAGRRILVLDDDDASREALAAALGGWGCEVSAAATVEQAAASVRLRPDLLIMDYHLDNSVTALDALDILRVHMDAAKPVLVISADRSAAVDEQVRRRGLEFLSKPINPARLRSLVTYLLCCPTAS